jgi:hypothetical protein
MQENIYSFQFVHEDGEGKRVFKEHANSLEEVFEIATGHADVLGDPWNLISILDMTHFYARLGVDPGMAVFEDDD